MGKGFNVSELGLNIGTYTGSKIGTAATNKLGELNDKATGVIDNLNELLTLEMLALITNGIDKVYNNLGLTESNIAFAKNLLNVADNYITKLDSIFSLLPKNMTVIPVTKDTLSPLTASLTQIAMAKYGEALNLYYQLTTSLMNIIGQPIEAVNACILILIEKVEGLVDEQIYKYTGYHLREIPALCIKGIQLVNQLKKLKPPKTNKNGKANSNNDDTQSKPYSSEGKSVSVDVTVDVNQLKENAYNEVKTQLYKYLEGIATPLYNAFMMLLLKELVILIKAMIQLFTDISLLNLKQNLQDVDTITELITEIIGVDPTYISLEDIKNLGLNTMLNVSSQFQSAVDNAKNVTSLTNNFNTGQLVGAASSTINVNVKLSKTYEIKEDKVDDKGNTYFNMILYKNPKSLFKVLNNNFKKIKDSKNNQIITNIDISNFINDLITLWNTEKNETLIVPAKIDDVNRQYIFNITLVKDKSTNDKQNEISEETQSKENNSDLSFKDKMNLYLDSLTNATPEIILDAKKKNQKMVFDIIGILLKQIEPIKELLLKLAVLIENYKINKEKVLNKSKGDMSKLLDKLLSDSGFKKLFDKGNNTDDSNNELNTNFYTVRTKKLNDWLIQNNMKPDPAGFCNITGKLTTLMINECLSFSENMSDLQKDISTNLYFDSDAINEELRIYNNIIKGHLTERNGKAYLDGTTNDLDNIRVDNHTGNIYITENGKSTVSSEILRAVSKQYNPRI